MRPIRTLEQLAEGVKGAPARRVAVAAGHDENTIEAAARAASEGIAKVILVGDAPRIEALCKELKLDIGVFSVIDERDEAKAGAKARDMVREGEADVLMKGLIGTDKYMHLILDKERGLLPAGAVLTHITVLDIPAYQKTHGKLLIVSDVAVIPAPDLPTKVKIVGYAVDAAHSFGIERPKVALLAANEKVSDKMPATTDAAIISKMAERGQIKGAIVDGPLALDVALSREACEIKGLASIVEGDADVLIFPNIETGNVFYKGATLLGGASLAAVVVGTSAPCILTSRADSEDSKFYSIALGCRLAK
ncbi:MAG: bifunctional enoyl-CoA hydratase/phosphate acetyltransferase [Acidobacteriia bacterium]|nr:bifunctional enoyl-CoA hydratase/phosphate acetyltransferase [Terriglobia bacterium]